MSAFGSMKVLVLLKTQQWEGAIQAFEKAIEAQPENNVAALCWFCKGYALCGLSRWEVAIQALEKAIEAQPENNIAALCWLCKGQALYGLSRWEGAIQAFEKAIEAQPENNVAALCWFCKGQALYGLSRWEEAVKCFDKAIEIDHQNADALFFKCQTLGKIGRLEEAFRAYGEAIKIDPEVTSRWPLIQATSWKKRTRRRAILKVAAEAIEIYTQIFNSFYLPNKEPIQTQSQESTAGGPKCAYAYRATSDKCSRPLLKGYDKCFWHATDTKKYDSKVMGEYFGSNIGLKEALEAEVDAGNSLEGAYLRDANIGGNWSTKGPMLSGAILRGAVSFKCLPKLRIIEWC